MVGKRALALAQHPMYFIIKEDTGCAERTPPWGAPDVGAYAERLERNLESLERYPECNFGYEWSGYELELLAAEFPEVFERMKRLGDAGNTAFYNGTYSQPHLQTLSSESCYRQFQYGMAAYRNLGLKAPVTYAHQEASLQDQVPQLLSAFDEQFAVVPGFSSTIEWIDQGELTIRWGDGLKFVHGAEFTTWVGLDGTTIPLYLINGANAPSVEDAVTIDIMQGLMGGPLIGLQIPDLIEVDDAWMAQMNDVDLVTLDDALTRRIEEAPPVGHVRFYSNWSYIEGIQAEALSRANAAAERALITAESIAACASVLTGYAASPLYEEWKTVLACQHHDVYCFCAPELKGKAVRWLRDIEKRGNDLVDHAVSEIAAHISIAPSFDGAIAVFNPSPSQSSGIVEVDLPDGITDLTDTHGNSVVFEQSGEPGDQVRFRAELGGMGYTAYAYHTGKQSRQRAGTDERLVFENAFYSAELNADGTVSSLIEKGTGRELLDTSDICGNSIAGTDSTGLSPQGTNVGRNQPWIRPERGPDLVWKPDGVAAMNRGPVTTRFATGGTLNENIDAELEIVFAAESPRIDIAWTFDFRDASIGNFYEDDTKLRVNWPLSFDGTVSHDIGFGIIDEHPGRPFTPASWTDISDGEIGLAYCHRGSPKHWFDGGVLTNLFAWGEFTEAIGSRMWRHNWMKCFDQRLEGTQRIEAAVIPHAGDWRASNIPHLARQYRYPFAVCVMKPHDGNLPREQTVLAADDCEMIVTSVQTNGDGIMCRYYRTGEGEAELSSDCVQLVHQQDLLGNEETILPAYRIAESTFTKI